MAGRVWFAEVLHPAALGGSGSKSALAPLRGQLCGGRPERGQGQLAKGVWAVSTRRPPLPNAQL